MAENPSQSKSMAVMAFGLLLGAGLALSTIAEVPPASWLNALQKQLFGHVFTSLTTFVLFFSVVAVVAVASLFTRPKPPPESRPSGTREDEDY